MKRKARLRANPSKTREWQQRSRERAPRQRARKGKRVPWWEQTNPTPRREEKDTPGANGWTQRVFTLHGRRCRVCGKRRAVQGHHVVPRQVIVTAPHLTREQRAMLAYDARNGLPVCLRCHERHELAVQRIPFEALPASVVEWAVEHGFEDRVFDERVYPSRRAA